MKTIPQHRLPSFWSGMGFTARAAWLCESKIAKDFSEACSMLARLPRKPKPRDVAPRKGEYWWAKES